MSKGPVVLAFSGGLDTSWCAVHLAETLGREVVTCTVDTGGFSPEEIAWIEERAGECGASTHVRVDARSLVYEDFARFFIAGNCLRGGVYPLCVAAERVVQAEQIARVAAERDASAVAHGSTGAGNDQIRFDVALRVRLPGVEILTPVRDLHLSRPDQYEFLKARGIEADVSVKTYSVNRGMWGTTIGGGALHDPKQPVPTDCWADTVAPDAAPAEGIELSVGFELGEPKTLDGEALDPVELLSRVAQVGAAHGVGRGIHTGDTILGIKGRLAFEAPAATILLFAHRELEKLVLTKDQQVWKDQLGAVYGQFVHEARYYDPLTQDIESFLSSSQRNVTGTVAMRLIRGRIEVVSVDTEHSLMGRLGAVYGEGSTAWTGAEARAFAGIYGLPSVLAARRDEETQQ